MNEGGSRAGPRVCVGLPVHNGEEHLEETLASLLAQTYLDFELLICDNASTDRTPEICRTFAERDPRIRYVRNGRNIGICNNFNRVFRLSRAEYFRWAGADDVCEPRLLEESVAILDADPGVVLVVPRGTFVNPLGWDPGDLTFTRAWSDGATERGRQLMEMLFAGRSMHVAFMSHGLMRAEALRAIGGMPNCPRGDQPMVLALGLAGAIRDTPSEVLRFRLHEGSFGARVLTHPNARNAWHQFNPGKRPPPLLGAWMVARHAFCVRAVMTSPLLSAPHKAMLGAESLAWSVRSFWWRGTHALAQRRRHVGAHAAGGASKGESASAA